MIIQIHIVDKYKGEKHKPRVRRASYGDISQTTSKLQFRPRGSVSTKLHNSHSTLTQAEGETETGKLYQLIPRRGQDEFDIAYGCKLVSPRLG